MAAALRPVFQGTPQIPKFVQQAFLPPAIRMARRVLAPFLNLVSQVCEFTPQGIFIPALSCFGEFVPEVI